MEPGTPPLCMPLKWNGDLIRNLVFWPIQSKLLVHKYYCDCVINENIFSILFSEEHNNKKEKKSTSIVQIFNWTKIQATFTK